MCNVKPNSSYIFFFSDNITLEQRIHYLSHSLVCMKSNKSGAAPLIGVLFQEVEDNLQVAQIQLKVMKLFSRISNSSNKYINEICSLIDSKNISKFCIQETRRRWCCSIFEHQIIQSDRSKCSSILQDPCSVKYVCLIIYLIFSCTKTTLIRSIYGNVN